MRVASQKGNALPSQTARSPRSREYPCPPLWGAERSTAGRRPLAEEHLEVGKVLLLPRSLRIQLLDCGVALSGGLAQRRNKVFGGVGLWCRSLMPRREGVSAIAILIAPPTSAYTVFVIVWPTAATRDDVIDRGLIGGGVGTEYCRTVAPVTSLVCVEP